MKVTSSIMNLSRERSCWGVARLALGSFLLCIAIVYLFGGLGLPTH